MTAITLRPYQERAVSEALAAVASHPTILVAPTGAGKTVMGAEAVVRNGARALWIAHRRELIGQAHERLLRSGILSGIILAGRPATVAPVQVASIQTLARREPPPADLVVIDECHHATADSYRALFDNYAHAKILGLTATPFRLDGIGLGDVGFRQIVVAASTAELCADGTLVEPTIFAPESPDLSAVHTVAGDFNQGEAADVMRGPKIVGRIVETWLARAQGRRTVVFAVNVEHSKSLRDRFRAAGVRAAHIDGTTGPAERAGILADLASHRIDVLCNCMILTEGWDLPALEVAIVARPTKSLQLHLQMLGRIMRAADGKAGALVLDHAGNYDRHGLPTRALTYSLDGSVKAAAIDSKKCPACGLVLALGENPCPDCGYVWGLSGGRPFVSEIEGALEVKHAAKAAPVTWDDKARFWRRAYHHAVHKGNPKIALARYKATFNEWPVHVEDRLVQPAHASANEITALREEWRKLGRQIALSKPWGRDNPAKASWFANKFASDKEREFRKAATGGA